jgi:hypothetical protein
LKWLGKGQATKYLGFQVGFDVPQLERDAKVIQQVKANWANGEESKFPCQLGS